MKETRKGYKSRHDASSSQSSSESPNLSGFDKLLRNKRIEKIQQRKNEKDRLKELETLDEKRARRIAKKMRKVI